MISIFTPPRITGLRTTVALGTALIVDAVQLVLGPLGFVTFLDDFLDVAAAGIITVAIGFHPLLLPTLLIEVLPVVDLIPTWTGCTLAVLALRKRSENHAAENPPAADPDHMKRATVIEEPPVRS